MSYFLDVQIKSREHRKQGFVPIGCGAGFVLEAWGAMVKQRRSTVQSAA